jgi:hypothetical protein
LTESWSIFDTDLYKIELLNSREGEEIIWALEEAEETFVDSSLSNRVAKLENVLDVIQKRMQGLYMLKAYCHGR